MKTYAAVSLFAVLFGLAGLAPAAELLSSPLPTGVGTSGACHIRNTGTTAVKVQVSLFANNDPVVTFDDCNQVPLPAGRTCRVVGDLPDSSYTACSVTAGNVTKLRGTLEIHAIVPDLEQGFPGGLLRTLVAEDLR